MNKKALAHVALYVSDFERSIRFYTEGLGLTLVRQWGEDKRRTALYDFGNGTGLELFERSNIRTGTPDIACTGAYWHYALEVDNVEEAFKRAVEYGAAVRNEPYICHNDAKPTDMDARIAFVFGPDHELIEFFKWL
jgi:catechol 2,3-dioxygenase-like lactoylglutathione lyase family enzyme